MVYDINVVSYLREKHNICGVLIGGLPQAPQQNVFLGLPVELMPEEARLLVEKKVAHIVDDVAAHKDAFIGNGLTAEERRAFQEAIDKRGALAAEEASQRADDKKKAYWQQKLGTDNWNDLPEDFMNASRDAGARKKKEARKARATLDINGASQATTPLPSPGLASGPPRDPMTGPPISRKPSPEGFGITPTTSHPPLSVRPKTSTETLNSKQSALPDVPGSYPLFKHLHGQGYFLSPGLRFGCQYTAYPGDPLRYHSHFLCSGMGWNEKFDLNDLVAGGRLGTGVKKGYMIGGQVGGDEQKEGSGDVRVFSLEWGGM